MAGETGRLSHSRAAHWPFLQVDVVIVGAGSAGLACAYELSKHPEIKVGGCGGGKGGPIEGQCVQLCAHVCASCIAPHPHPPPPSVAFGLNPFACPLHSAPCPPAPAPAHRPPACSAMVIRKPAHRLLDELNIVYDDEGSFVVVKV